MTNWKISLKAMVFGAVAGTAFGVAAFLLLTSWHQGMGEALFLLVPVAAGFSIAMVARGQNSATAAAVLAVLSTLIILVALGKEGPLCAALAFPIIVVGLAIGLGIAVLVRKLFVDRTDHQTTTMGLLLLIGPALVLVGDRIEQPAFARSRIDVIKTSISVPAPPERVWANILSIDNVRASKPFLMYIGLPVPQRCSMQGQGVGAKRTCYFNSGYIEETITGWDPPYYMGFAIDRTHMPGRHWLGFESAEYRLLANGTSTRLIRTTTISSHLRPAWYWQTFERMGVESEHRYILQEVSSRSVR